MSSPAVCRPILGERPNHWNSPNPPTNSDTAGTILSWPLPCPHLNSPLPVPRPKPQIHAISTFPLEYTLPPPENSSHAKWWRALVRSGPGHSQGTLIAVRISLNTYKEFESGALDAIQAKPINQPMIGGEAEIFELSPIYKLITAGAQTGPDPARYLKTNYLVHYWIFGKFFVFAFARRPTLSCDTVDIMRYAVETSGQYLPCPATYDDDDDDDKDSSCSSSLS